MCQLPDPERGECFDGLERLVKQLHWKNCPGVLVLAVKGSSMFPAAYEQTVVLLTSLLDVLKVFLCRILYMLKTLSTQHPAVDPHGGGGTALAIIAVLPYLLLRYDQPNDVCVHAAAVLAQVSSLRCFAACQIDNGLPMHAVLCG